MITLLITFLLIILITFIAAQFEFDQTVYKIIVIAVLIFGIIATWINYGYKEPVLTEEIELANIASTGYLQDYYVKVSADNEYSYRCETYNTTKMTGPMFKTYTLTGDVEELESKACNKPVLKVYVSKPKGKWWFTFIEEKISYVFYVPEGTIKKD